MKLPGGDLDPWQRHLCEELDRRIVHGKGARLLIHAPPQMGKSCIVSQRLPAVILRARPEARVKVACYNIRRATGFTRTALGMVRWRCPEIAPVGPCSADEWSTPQRQALHDPQSSCKALGLLSGFVGEGVDDLIIDDPYASPQDAMSEAVNGSVWTFWDAAAKVRIDETTNVAVMFHRYTFDDLAGRLIDREGLVRDGGRWELLRYAAQWEDDPEYPCAPRELYTPEGYLSPRKSVAWYEEQQASPEWMGQFQGRPAPPGGAFFKPGEIELVDGPPPCVRRCRAWDLAATANGGDWTVGGMVGVDRDGRTCIIDVVRGQWGPDECDRMLLTLHQIDPMDVTWHLAQDPGAAGKRDAVRLGRMLAGRPLRIEPVTGPKTTRAAGFAAQMNLGNVRMVRAAWNRALVSELMRFSGNPTDVDDQVDALSDAFSEVTMRRQARGA